jgi:hypothetical protein
MLGRTVKCGSLLVLLIFTTRGDKALVTGSSPALGRGPKIGSEPWLESARRLDFLKVEILPNLEPS